jgi:hypothetical protein
VKRQHCWALRIKSGKFVNAPIVQNFWEADRTLLFRTKKMAEAWLSSNKFWNPKAYVVRVTITIKEFGE